MTLFVPCRESLSENEVNTERKSEQGDRWKQRDGGEGDTWTHIPALHPKLTAPDSAALRASN